MYEKKALNKTVRIGQAEFCWGERTYIMGIINLSPDSFSGDGIRGAEEALLLAKQLFDEGADILDVGGEFNPRVTNRLQQRKNCGGCIPVIEQLAAEINIPVSVDTCKPEVAARAIKAGASLLNSVAGLNTDQGMLTLVAREGIPVILTANQRGKQIIDVTKSTIAELNILVERAIEEGVSTDKIVVDPGIGFGKSPDQNLEIIRRLAEIKALGLPVLVGPSRKSFIGHVLDLPENDRVEGTAAAVAIAIVGGADIVRVHDVKVISRISRMSDAIVRSKKS
jgi:dihydropteroate synthase